MLDDDDVIVSRFIVQQPAEQNARSTKQGQHVFKIRHWAELAVGEAWCFVLEGNFARVHQLCGRGRPTAKVD